MIAPHKKNVHITHMKHVDLILRPLARLAIRRGWTFGEVSERLRRAFLVAARAEAGPDATDSRLSVMTGLQRRDIARLKDSTDPKPQRQPLSEIIALWAEDPAFDTSALPAKGPHPSFASLAAQVRKDVHPRTFLDMLIAAGAVTETDDGLRLSARGYQPLPGSEDQLAYLGANVGDHLSAAVTNIVDGADAYDVSVHYTGLNAEAVARIEALWRQKQQELAQELNRFVRHLPAEADGDQRFRAGAYFHSEGPDA